MTVSEFIRNIQGYEEYSFSWEELVQDTQGSTSTIRKELDRLADSHEIIKLRTGYYLIIPPRYHDFNRLPIQLYVDKLFKSVNKRYYLGLYSAAGFHGASHQKIQQDYVITEAPSILDIKKGNVKIKFLTVKNWPESNIVKMKSDAGLFNVSSPALTFIDLVHFHSKIGGLNRMLAILEELLPEITLNDLTSLLTWYPYRSSIQRMGYLMDHLSSPEELIEVVRKHLDRETYFPVLLSPRVKGKAGAAPNQWKVDVNVELQSDLA